MKIIVSKKFDNKTLGYFLDYYKQSKKNKYLLFLENKIKVNDSKSNAETILRLNDEITIINDTGIDYILDELSVDVVYEDDIILIVNKPTGIIVHKEKNETGSLANRVARYYKDKGLDLPIRHLHRLDEQTQGLIVYCKSSFFQPYLDYLLSIKKIKRYYKAIVFNMANKEEFTINEPIGKDRHDSKKYRVSKTGKEAKAHVKILSTKGKYSLCECELETGRTHQIRVHLSYLNMFIVNDVLYGKKSNDFKDMGLYAYKLEWHDILTDKKMMVELPSNKDLNYFEMF